MSKASVLEILLMGALAGCESEQSRTGPVLTGPDADLEATGEITWSDNGVPYSGAPAGATLIVGPVQGTTQTVARMAVAVAPVDTVVTRLTFGVNAPGPLAEGEFTCAAAQTSEARYGLMGYFSMQGDQSALKSCGVSLTQAPTASNNIAIGTFSGTAMLSDGAHTISNGRFRLPIPIMQVGLGP